MKLTLTITAFFGLVHTSELLAEPATDPNNAMVMDNQLQGVELSPTSLTPQDENSMSWPMLPGENLNEVARLFYPKNQSMQRQFVKKALQLSQDVQPNLTPKLRFKEPTLLVIPTLKSLSFKASRTKKVSKKAKVQTLSLSYQIEKIPEAMLKEYEELVIRNEFLKQELAKLNEKLIFLQSKLNELKLQFDKTLGSQNANIGTENLQLKDLAPIAEKSEKKVFKNLNKIADEPKVNAQEISSIGNWFDTKALFSVLGLGALFGLIAFLFKKHRESVDAKLSFVASKVQESVAELNGLWQPTRGATASTLGIKTSQQAQVNGVTGTDANVSSSLEEAKLLMSINRTSDAIAHLKMTIKSSPKGSINHWLYLLDIFRKLKLKDEFEHYAKELHTTFNVLPPVWDNADVAIATPKTLQGFPHIMEKLYKTWPEDAAYQYLRGLIADNRGGERIGFAKEVVEEIVMLMELIVTRKALA